MNERIALIIRENGLKQKDLAALIGVTESYISALLSKRNIKMSMSLATLIEEKLGYSAQWRLTGEGAKLKQSGKNQSLSDAHRLVILQLERMSDEQIRAVLTFIDSLDKIQSSFTGDDKQ